MDEWDWHRVLDVNLTGAFLMTQSVGRVMRVKGGGVIINLITESVRDGKSGAAFVASMEGLRGFTLQAARELSPFGIRVHAVTSDRDHIVETVLALLMEEKE
jgi:NAD(P)-dependent dehydrogenase (short-subunit alcohol dehydrogenase family)